MACTHAYTRGSAVGVTCELSACVQVCGSEQNNAPLQPIPFAISFSGGWVGGGYDDSDIVDQPALVMSGQQTPVVMPTPYNRGRDPCASSVTVSRAAVLPAHASHKTFSAPDACAHKICIGGTYGGLHGAACSSTASWCITFCLVKKVLLL